MGLSSQGRLLVVSHADEGDTIRLIGARPAGRAERRSYEQGQDMRKEYDFSEGVRGKYADRVGDLAKLVALDPDPAREFPTAEAVNEALRSVVKEKERGEHPSDAGQPHAPADQRLSRWRLS